MLGMRFSPWYSMHRPFEEGVLFCFVFVCLFLFLLLLLLLFVRGGVFFCLFVCLLPNIFTVHAIGKVMIFVNIRACVESVFYGCTCPKWHEMGAWNKQSQNIDKRAKGSCSALLKLMRPHEAPDETSVGIIQENHTLCIINAFHDGLMETRTSCL